MRVIRALALILVGLSPLSAFAQEAKIFDGRAKPFGFADIPVSGLKASLNGLSAEARAKAIANLNRFSFPAADVNYLRADRAGNIYYVEPKRVIPPFRGGAKTQGLTSPVARLAAEDVFKLHSRPSSPKKAYLDFRGGPVSGTAWNENSAATFQTIPFSEDGDTTTFNQDELNTIADVWRRMADDYAPFDIDITTEPPPAFGPNVMHVKFTPVVDANGREIVGGGPGGIAYVWIWGRDDAVYLQPAWVFSDGVWGAKGLAEAGSHELGHNIGLAHDGTSKDGYYGGHGSGHTSWSPIMGVGYYTEISTWSKGEYLDANNHEDDMGILSNQIGWRPDDHGNKVSNASPLVITNGVINSVTMVSAPNDTTAVNRGIISNAKDVDMFCANVTGVGKAVLTVTPAWLQTFRPDMPRGDDLHVRMVLYRVDANGVSSVIRSVRRINDTYATMSVNMTPGRYCLAVTGIGLGDSLGTGYTRYGSIGNYNIRGKIPMAARAK